MFSDLQRKMICFPIILDRLTWEGKNRKDLPIEIRRLLEFASIASTDVYKPITETYQDLPELANALAFNVLDVVFGEQTDDRMMNIYVIQLTTKILDYYKTYDLLEKAVIISKRFTTGAYPSFQMTWYKAIMYEVNQELSDHFARELIEEAKAMMSVKDYSHLNDVLRKAMTINPNCKDEINSLFDV